MPTSLSNGFMIAILESPLNRILGSGFAVVTVIGRKTGKRYSTPVNAQREGDSFTVISSRSRTWWRNLRGGGRGHLLVRGERHAVEGEVIEEPALVAEALSAYFARHPRVSRFFGVKLSEEGKLPPEDVRRLAAERVVIHLRPKK